MTPGLRIAGGCLCGQVRYRSDAAPITVRICWCRVCQFLGGGSGTVNVVLPSAEFIIEGRLATYSSLADSGAVMYRRFCPECGTPVLSEAEPRPHLVVLRAGTLDDPELARPKSTIWTAAAPSWACIDATLPRLDAQPPPVGQTRG